MFLKLFAALHLRAEKNVDVIEATKSGHHALGQFREEMLLQGECIKQKIPLRPQSTEDDLYNNY